MKYYLIKLNYFINLKNYWYLKYFLLLIKIYKIDSKLVSNY